MTQVWHLWSTSIDGFTLLKGKGTMSSSIAESAPARPSTDSHCHDTRSLPKLRGEHAAGGGQNDWNFHNASEDAAVTMEVMIGQAI